MWWSAGAGGGRLVDAWLRETYQIASGTVQSVNSLKGAVLVQGILLAMIVRERIPSIQVTETHPKALLKAMNLRDWTSVSEAFDLEGVEPRTEHERDALVGAVVARFGHTGRWTQDLAVMRGPSELGPNRMWFGQVHYWWPDT